jgi:hypothetical protein
LQRVSSGGIGEEKEVAGDLIDGPVAQSPASKPALAKSPGIELDRVRRMVLEEFIRFTSNVVIDSVALVIGRVAKNVPVNVPPFSGPLSGFELPDGANVPLTL